MPRVFHTTRNNHFEPIAKVEKPLIIMLRDNFLGGIAWSLGATLGLAVVVGLASYFLSQFVNVPFIGSFIADIVEATNKSLQKR